MFFTQIIDSIICEYYRKRFRYCGRNLRFHPRNSVFEYRNISIGERVFINRGAYFSAPNGRITIGNDVLVGADVFIAAGHHKYKDIGKTISQQGYLSEEQHIVIGDDVWIASKAIILGNVKINDGAIIGAGSMVLRDIPPYCLCVGNPHCIPVRYRYSDDELRQHLSKLGKESDAIERIINLRRDMTKDCDFKLA